MQQVSDTDAEALAPNGDNPPVKDIDGILEAIGEFGRFQIVLELLLCIAMIPQTIPALISYFIVNNPPWRCKANSTLCILNGSISTDSEMHNSRCLIPRSEWEFTVAKDFSVVTEFDLHCKTDFLIHVDTSLFFLGWGIGAIFLGWLADSHGRKKVVFFSLFAIMACGTIISLAPNIWTYIAIRFIGGFFQPGAGPQMNILASEFVGPKYRPLAGILLFFFFTIALVILGIAAYFVRHWRTLSLITSAPFLFVLLFAFYVPESVRWLHTRGRTGEARNILVRIAKINKKPFPAVKMEPLHDTVENKSGTHIKVFIASKKVFIQTSVQALGWLVGGLVYYGMSFAADELGGGMYSDFIFSSLVEFPAAILAIICCGRLGRKRTVIGPLVVSALACVLVPAVPIAVNNAYTVLRVSIGMLGKCLVTMSFDSIYTWSFELFPTVIRAEGMGILQIASRVGAASAPWISKWLEEIHRSLPFFIMGGCGFIGSVAMLYLPETKGKATSETLDESFNGANLKIDAPEENEPLLENESSINQDVI